MKFAYMELKIGLVKILQKYEIQPCSKTPEKLEFDEGSVRVPKNGVSVIFKNRNNS